jgi:hypothetical protein
MRHTWLITTTLWVLVFANCTLASQPLDQKAVQRSLLALFAAQDPTVETYNGTLQFTLANNYTLYIRNNQLSLQGPADSFIQAGLTRQEDILLSRYVLFNQQQKRLLFASNHLQSLDMQYLKPQEIIQHLVASSQEELSPLQLNHENGVFVLTDGVLLLTWQEQTLQVGIARNVLQAIGVDASHLPDTTLIQDYVIVATN